MSVNSTANISVEEKLRRTITWYRVPLLILPFAVLVAYVHDIGAFWYSVPVAIFGQLLQTWAGSHLHKDQKLTISGPYSHVRNPMYIGRFVLGLGFFIITANPYLIAGYVIIFAAYAHFRVAREESRLRVIFEPDYQHYCSEIRRWLPKFKPYSRSESKNASWAQVCANHENINMLGVLVVLAAIYLRIANIDWHL